MLSGRTQPHGTSREKKNREGLGLRGGPVDWDFRGSMRGEDQNTKSAKKEKGERRGTSGSTKMRGGDESRNSELLHQGDFLSRGGRGT